MSKKEQFIEWVNLMLETNEMSEDAKVYFDALCGSNDKEKPAFTENGKMILQYMKENKDTYNNLFKAKEVGEGLGVTSRTASGAMRKLTTDGYIEKMSESPAIYALTDKGIEVSFDAE